MRTVSSPPVNGCGGGDGGDCGISFSKDHGSRGVGRPHSVGRRIALGRLVAGWVRWQRQLQYPPLGFKNKSTVAIRYFRRRTHLSVGDEMVSVIFIARFSS
ncbi:hypothetical protein FWK35_00008393 [Aphis craccivora]|uniref:Uncharacterized protein n=1 Tax=Aphis craccivora TaxID=307492 RepID=A0A6G0Z9Q3_APHCR|nr:hypothetical protein FWK35_00008393 [Aphis craccivora]